MKPFPKLHDLYVGRVLLGTVLLTWAVLVGMDFVVSGLLGELGDVGKGDYTFATALIDVIYTIPRRAYQLFPEGDGAGAQKETAEQKAFARATRGVHW